MGTFHEWIGRSEQRSDRLRAEPIAMLDAAFDHPGRMPEAAQDLPPLRHWLYFHAPLRRSDTAVDGHAAKGGFLPPVELPRRMWAAGEIEFVRALSPGAQVTRTSTIRAIERKQGRSGELVFVDVEHCIAEDGHAKPAIIENQRIVYRADGAASAAGEAATERGDWEHAFVTDEVLLFRYSALTANAHRIHYDRRYACDVENHRDLVVHGPLQATLLVDAWQRAFPDAVLRHFSFRAIAPSFVGEALALCGRRMGDSEAELWLRRADGSVGMRAHVAFATRA
jgi:3-methylfumaryl-CoA hydratase